ncbi:MAG: hypothetical protein WCY33_04910, partial [Clostridia bacterium]
TVEGRGFTGLLISWLAHVNPLAMGLVSFLFVFIDNGASQVSNYARLGASYPKVMTGIFFFFIIATEFFINYRIVFKKKKVKEITDNGDTISGETEPMKDEIETDKDNTKENINEEIVKEKV